MICDRRTFVVTASGLALGTRMASAAVQGANDRIRIGVIGTGGRARSLMTHLKKLPGNEMTAICDVYEPRLLQAAEIAGAAALKVADYRRILDNREIDAVVIGTPDHWHKTITLDASPPARTSTSRSRSRTRSRKAPRWSRRSKRRSRSCRPAPSSAAGSTGCSASRSSTPASSVRSRSSRPTGISTRRAGNYAPVAMDKLDWKRWLGPAPDQPFRPERFYQWRHFWDFGGGCLTDLMTHWIDVVHWYMDVDAPLSAATTGTQLQHQAVGGARHRQHDARVPKELHGGVPRHLRQPGRRRRARVPRRSRHAEDRSGAAGVLSRRCGVRAGHAHAGARYLRAIERRRHADAPAELARLHPEPQDAERQYSRRAPGGADVAHRQRCPRSRSAVRWNNASEQIEST